MARVRRARDVPATCSSSEKYFNMRQVASQACPFFLWRLWEDVRCFCAFALRGEGSGLGLDINSDDLNIRRQCQTAFIPYKTTQSRREASISQFYYSQYFWKDVFSCGPLMKPKQTRNAWPLCYQSKAMEEEMKSAHYHHKSRQYTVPAAS